MSPESLVGASTGRLTPCALATNFPGAATHFSHLQSSEAEVGGIFEQRECHLRRQVAQLKSLEILFSGCLQLRHTLAFGCEAFEEPEIVETPSSALDDFKPSSFERVLSVNSVGGRSL
jgi:hypothetical protein